MVKLLLDTCIWEDLAKDPSQRPLLNVILQLEHSKELGLIVPRVVIEEFERRKPRIATENTRSLSGLLKRIKAIVGKHGDGEGREVALNQLNYVDGKLPRLGDAAETAIANIEPLLSSAEIVETTDAILVRAAKRALEKKAPFIRERNLADAIIVETFAESLRERAEEGTRFALVTSNKHDFSDMHKDERQPHPDIAALFQTPEVGYFINLVDALNWIDPDAVSEHAFDFANQPRRTDEILHALDVLWHQIWYNRHQNWLVRISRGEEQPNTRILQQAEEAARRVERTYGKENLGPWDDFEWGMLNGKMSALNWVLGEEWNFLDT